MHPRCGDYCGQPQAWRAFRRTQDLNLVRLVRLVVFYKKKNILLLIKKRQGVTMLKLFWPGKNQGFGLKSTPCRFLQRGAAKGSSKAQKEPPFRASWKVFPGHLDSPDVESCPKWKLSEMQMSPVWMLLAMFACLFQQPSRREALEASLCRSKNRLSSLHAVSGLQSPAVFLTSLAACEKSAQEQGT